MSDKDLPVNEENQVQPSGISHAFDTGYAMAYGVDEAIMIRNLQFFITANANRGHNFREGRYWTYDRLEDFLSHFPYWSVQTVRRILASLISQDVIIKGEFNQKWSNRTQWYAFKDQDKFIKHVRIPKTPSPTFSPDLLKPTTDSCGNQQLTDVETNNCNIDTSTVTSAISSSSSLEVPKEPTATDVAEVGVVSSSSEKKKRTRTPAMFSSKVKDFSEKMVNILKEAHPVYRLPDTLEKFMSAVEAMLEKDGQDPETILKTFKWACNDNEQRGDFKGWQAIICTNKRRGKPSTPAEIFRHHFSTIYSQMQSRPQRKFAPSSNDDKAIAIMEEMARRAL